MLSVVRAAPRPVLDAVAASGARALGRRPNGPMRQWQRNVELATGRRPDVELTREAARSWARNLIDSAQLSDWPTGRVLEVVTMSEPDWQRLSTAFHTTGAVLALPHQGSWDMAGAWVCQKGLPVSSVAENLEPTEYLFFAEARARMGMRIHAHTDPDVSAKLLADQRSGRMVCLLMDRDLSRWGTRVQWPTPNGSITVRVPNGAARIALDTGATLFAVTTHYTERGLHIDVSAPITAPRGPGQVRSMCQQVIDVFAGAIAQHPADWHMLVRFFPDPTTPGTPAASATDEHQTGGSQ